MKKMMVSDCNVNYIRIFSKREILFKIIFSFERVYIQKIVY